MFKYSRKSSFEIALKIQSTPTFEIQLSSKSNSRRLSSLRSSMPAMSGLIQESARLHDLRLNFKLERRVILEIAADKEISNSGVNL